MLASGHHSKSFLLRSRVSGLSRHQLSAEVDDGMVEVAVVCLSQNCTNSPPRGISLQQCPAQRHQSAPMPLPEASVCSNAPPRGISLQQCPTQRHQSAAMPRPEASVCSNAPPRGISLHQCPAQRHQSAA